MSEPEGGAELAVRVLASLEEASRAAAERVTRLAVESIAARGRFAIALAGGGTPRRLYEMLGAAVGGPVRWDAVHLFWGDERCVPPDDERSNYRLVADTLLAAAPVPPANVHRVRGELRPAEAAREYAAELAAFFGAPRPGALGAAGAYAFDLVLLGVGADGHTASLFAGSPALAADEWAMAVQAPPSAPVRDRVTLTLAAVNASRRALFLVAGADKAEVVAAALAREEGVVAGGVGGRVEWVVDEGASPAAS